MIDVKAIAERCEKVPPAPWVAISAVAEGGDDSDTYFIKAQPHPAMRGFTKDIAMVEGADLADFIAHARQNIPDLLAENADLRRQIIELQGKIAILEKIEHAFTMAALTADAAQEPQPATSEGEE